MSKKNVFKLSFLLMVTLLVMTGCTSSGNKENSNSNGAKGVYKSITPKEVKSIMEGDKKYTLIDVRTQVEFDDEHIPSAILIPDFQIKEKADTMLPDKDALIIVYCRSGNRSRTASEALVDLGYTNVRDLGGITSWPYELE